MIANNKLFSNNFNSIHLGGIGGTTTSSNPPGLLNPSGANEPQSYYNSNFIQKNLLNGHNFSTDVDPSGPSFKLSGPSSQLQLRTGFNNAGSSIISESGHMTIDNNDDSD